MDILDTHTLTPREETLLSELAGGETFIESFRGSVGPWWGFNGAWIVALSTSKICLFRVQSFENGFVLKRVLPLTTVASVSVRTLRRWGVRQVALTIHGTSGHVFSVKSPYREALALVDATNKILGASDS